MNHPRPPSHLLVVAPPTTTARVAAALAATRPGWTHHPVETLAAAKLAARSGKRFDAVLLELATLDAQHLKIVADARLLFPAAALLVLTEEEVEGGQSHLVDAGAQDCVAKGKLDEGLSRTLQQAISRRKLERRLAESEAKHRAVVNLAPDAILVVSAPTRLIASRIRILSANPAAARMFSTSADALVGAPLASVLPDAPPLLYTPAAPAGPTRSDGLGCRGGEAFPVAMAAAPLGSGRFVVSATDITERVRLTETLFRQAHTDPLTGLANRRAFVESAESQFQGVCAGGQDAAVLMIDADHFKRINDTHGHEAGDAALVYLSSVIRVVARASDLPARFGGEEFIVLLVGARMDRALEMAERIRAQIAAGRVDGPSGPFGLTVSIGVASFEAKDGRWEDAVRRADQAVYEAKELGRNRVVGLTAESSDATKAEPPHSPRVRKP